MIVPMQHLFGWCSVFWVLGVMGLAWAWIWHRHFHNQPEQDPKISTAELEEIGDALLAGSPRPVPWRQILRSRPLWMVVFAYGCYGSGSWFYFSWFPTWVIHRTGLSLDGVLFNALPFAMGLAGNLAGGVRGDRLSACWGAKTALRAIPAVCLTLTAVILAAMAACHGAVAVFVLQCLGFGTMDLMLPSAWAMCVAIGGRSSGTATGMMNTAGQAGGFLCTVLFGYIVEATGSYSLPLWFIAGMALVSALAFASIDCTQSLDSVAASAP